MQEGLGVRTACAYFIKVIFGKSYFRVECMFLH